MRRAFKHGLRNAWATNDDRWEFVVDLALWALPVNVEIAPGYVEIRVLCFSVSCLR